MQTYNTRARHSYAKTKAIQISISSLHAAALSPLPKRRRSDRPVIPQNVDHHSMLCCRYASLHPRSIASLLGPPIWDSTKLQLGSFLTSKEHRLAAWPSHLGLGQTAAGLLSYFQVASPRCLALPLGTRPNCNWAPSLHPRSIASLLGPPTWDSAKLQLGSFLTSK
ncbi:hypothetical protein Adt_14543 [Abeliophyllum distichum]|uniref:Uncharacterized protein n=1 Tax=Abeliophyllum distichum TaxID=126358 RepID=A0ABD1TZX8_9LAMI